MMIEPAGFFLARTPLLPVDAWHAWTTAADDDGGSRKHLEELLDDPISREALSLGSRSLGERASEWRRRKSKEGALCSHGDIERPLARYLTRMSTRCTPFATHAGVSLGTIADTGQEEERFPLELRAKELGWQRPHLDLDVVEHWLQGVAEKHRERLVWRPNPTLRAYGRGYRFMTRKARSRAEGTDFVVSDSFIESDHETEALLSLAKKEEGLQLTSLPRDADLANALIRAQVLVSDLFFVARVSSSDPAALVVDRLNALGLTDEARALPLIEGALRVDLVKPHEHLELSKSFCVSVGEVMLDLARMQEEHPSIRAFRNAWLSRYGEREVPFAEAIDPETGIFATLDHQEEERTAAHDRRETFLQRKLIDLETLGEREWKLSKAEATKLFVRGDRELHESLPSRMELLGVLFRPNQHSSKLAMVLSRGSGVHGSLLGRFTRLGPDFAQAIGGHLREEGEQNDTHTLCADIDVQPADDTGGATSRVAIHPLRVTTASEEGGGGEEENVVPMNDLRVRLHRGRFHVFSSRRRTRIELRLTHSHAFWTKQNPRAYRLLCHLARQPNHVGLSFPWGKLLRASRRLPRVTYQGHVMSPAQWTFEREEVITWFDDDDDGRSREALQRARSRYAIPRYVLLTSDDAGDNRLALDLDSPQSLASARAALPKSGDVRFVEALGITMNDAPARGPEGGFASEVVIPFRRITPPFAEDGALATLPPQPSVRRWHPPGSGEWTYVKLYCGPRSADRVLATFVRPLIASLKRKLDDDAGGSAFQWFFLRDADPDEHLRIRVRTRSPAGAALLLETLAKRQRVLERRGAGGSEICRTTIDTYEREIERYGGFGTIEAAEEIFAHDSDASLRLLCDERLGLVWKPELRFLTTLLSLSRWMHLLPITNDERLALLRSAREGTWKLLGLPADYEGVLSRQFRARRSMIEELLSSNDDQTESLAHRTLTKRDEALKAPLERIARAERAGKTTTTLAAMGRSIGHLIVSRMMPAPSRIEELSLLDALCRHELSMAKRKTSTRMDPT